MKSSSLRKVIRSKDSSKILLIEILFKNVSRNVRIRKIANELQNDLQKFYKAFLIL